MKFRQIAHLYLGCQITYKRYDEGAEQPRQVTRTLTPECLLTLCELSDWGAVEGHITEVRPLLKKIRGGMKGEDAVRYHDILFPDTKDKYSARSKENYIILRLDNTQIYYELIPLMLADGFDLFNLIESGEAIELTPTTNPKGEKL